MGNNNSEKRDKVTETSEHDKWEHFVLDSNMKFI